MSHIRRSFGSWVPGKAVYLFIYFSLPLSLSFFQSQLYMHLTNYSVNKHNENFERDETVDKGSKRSIGWFTEFLRVNNYDVAKFWGDVSVSLPCTQTRSGGNRYRFRRWLSLTERYY